MSKVRSLVPVCMLLTALGWGWAIAQPVATVERPAMGVRFDVPADWVVQVVDASEHEETLGFDPYDGAGLVVVAMGRLTDADLADLEAAGEAALREGWAVFASEIPGVRVERERVRTVAGFEARVIDYAADDGTGSMIGVVGAGVGVIVFSIAVDERVDEVRAGLETLLSSFAILAAGAPPPAGAGNPLAPPTRSSDGGNPLAPPPPDASARASVAEPGYREPFTGTDPSGLFGGVLDVGSDGPWTAALTGSAYRLTNDAAPGAVRYYYLMDLPGEAGPLAQGTLGVTLGLAPGDGLSAAGLLFDFDPTDGSYLAFALTTTGYVVLQRSEEGLELLVDETLDTLRPDGRNRLELRAAGTAVEVVVNGATAATLNGSRPFSGGVGLVAIGAGVFEFQDFHYQRP